MFGLRSNCELVYAWIGAFAGLLAGFILETTPLPSVTTQAGLGGGLFLGLGASLLVAMIFCLFYRQSLFRLWLSTILGSILIGILVIAIGAVLPLPAFQVAVMFLIGSLVGQVVGRLICSRCLGDGVGRALRADLIYRR